MKIAIAISVLILAAAAGLGWKIDGHLAAARVKEQELTDEAQRLGVSEVDAHFTRSANRIRIDRNAEAKLLAIEQIQLVKAIEQGGSRDEAWQKRGQKCVECISALDASGLKILITDLLASKELSQRGKAEAALSLLGLNLAKRDPSGALAFATEQVSALSHGRNGIENVIYNSLANWAKDDPLAAVQWMKKNAAEFPDAMRAQSLHNVFHSAAEKEPRLALTLIVELGLNYLDSHGAVHTVVTAATTDDERTAVLEALREFRKSNQSNKDLVRAADDNLGYLSNGLRQSSFETASKWVDSVNLNPKELDGFCERLSNGIVEEPGKWIEWMGERFPAGKGDSSIMDLIGRWTETDYEAAGKWLASAPDGPARIAAIRGYAQEIFPHDRETAMQWLMTLPPGEERQNTLRYIRVNCLRGDPEAAAAFAKEHGLK